jgi:ferredoxin/flavodoxin---NADP+ reductase
VFPIVAVESLAPTVTRYVVEAPLVARKREAGQFVMVRLDERGERVPLTLVDSDPVRGTVTLIVQTVGKTTRQMASLRAGDALLDLLGPLGNPTPISHHGAVACVGGGVGTAVLLPIARALRAAGNAVHGVLGARSGDLVILEREMREISESLAVSTDDGSRGRMGLVTGPLEELLDGPAGIRAVYAIGPLVTVGGRMRFACVDGPEFDAHEVDFDELVRRARTYSSEERRADALFRERSAPGTAP